MATGRGFIRAFNSTKVAKCIGIITLFLFSFLALNDTLLSSLIRLYLNNGEHSPDSMLGTFSVNKLQKWEISSNDSDQLSTCNKEATELGLQQKVISFSLYVNEESDVPMFVEGIERNLKLVPEIYPGWVVRIYTNIPPDHAVPAELLKKYKSLFWCDVSNIPGLGNLTGMDGRSWRFLAMGDPLVDIFISRDLDSTISWRERFAVGEWEFSGHPIHLMRDNINHGGNMPILGGMWGAQNKLLGSKLSKELQRKIIRIAKLSKKGKGYDQFVLLWTIYMKFHESTMSHDSYFCGEYPDGLPLPFPTRRRGNSFVGEIIRSSGPVQPCPEKCRPPYMKHWKYC